MSEEFVLNATVRTDMGKGASRRLRRLNDQIPAIIYGGKKKPTSITLPHKDIMKAIENEAFFSHVITLNVDGKGEQTLIKALQRHPAKNIILHADFQRINANQAVHVKVPLHFINEEACVGVKLGGGHISHLLTELDVSCLPKYLPEFIEVDMIELDIGDSLHISDITLPEGVSSVDLSHGEASDHAVAAVQAAKGGDEDDVDEDAETDESSDDAAPAEDAES